MSADNTPWDTTELGKLGGETFSADYDPRRGVVRISGRGVEPEEFAVDADRWQQQAARELAARGYGARWTRWEDGQDGTQVMSTARTSYPDTDTNRPRPAETETETGWENGAARYSASAPAAPEPQPPTPPQYGRVRVFPQYRFPVYQTGPGGIGTKQEVTITDWDKKGRAWAEAEAKRQVTAALGEPSEEATGGPWWMGRATKETFRWQPLKGTPRSAKPFDGLPPPPPWTPWRSTGTGTGTGTGTAETAMWPDGAPTRMGPGGEPISPAEYDRRVEAAEAAGTPYMLRSQDVQPGDRVLDTSNGELGTVREITPHGGVRVEYDRELTPGHPGTKGVLVSSLEGGALQQVPRDATYASLEDRMPPAEQAARYAARQQHHQEQRGDGKRARNGYRKHASGCRVCTDIDGGGDGAGRQLAVVPAAPPANPTGGDAEQYPVKFTYTGGGEEGEVRHWAFESALDALNDHVGAYTIPDDGTGVLDVDAFIASIGGYVDGLAGVLAAIADRLGGGQTPIAPVVAEVLADFAGALQVMSGEAGEVYQQWADNEDNAHDLRRAWGEIPGANLFNVSAA